MLHSSIAHGRRRLRATTIRLTLLALLAAVFLLPGCGGDGTEAVSVGLPEVAAVDLSLPPQLHITGSHLLWAVELDGGPAPIGVHTEVVSHSVVSGTEKSVYRDLATAQSIGVAHGVAVIAATPRHADLSGPLLSSEVVVCNLTTGKRSTVCPAANSPIDVAGGDRMIVWTDQRPVATAPDIYAYDMVKRTAIPICVAGGEQGSPEASDRAVVWLDILSGRERAEVRGVDLDTGSQFLAGSIDRPWADLAIDAGTVVWAPRYTDETADSFFVYRLGDEQAREIPVDGGGLAGLDVWDDLVVYCQRQGAERTRICICDLRSDKTSVVSAWTTDGSSVFSPVIDDGTAAWVRSDRGLAYSVSFVSVSR